MEVSSDLLLQSLQKNDKHDKADVTAVVQLSELRPPDFRLSQQFYPTQMFEPVNLH